MLPPANMFSMLRRCARRTSLPGIAALATGLCLLAPTVAGAHGKAHLESGVSEASTTAPLQEPTTEPPTTNATTTTTTTTTESTTNARSRREERRARRNAQAQTGCSVNLEATPSTIAPGAPLGLAGTLSCPEGASATGQTVTLYQKVAHTPGFSVTATATTEAGGAFQFSLSEVEANSVYYVRCDGSRSARTKVKVAVQVDIEAPAAGAELFIGIGHAAYQHVTGHSSSSTTTAENSSSSYSTSADSANANVVTFTGTVSPDDAGATVALQREYRKERWHRIGIGQVDGEGKFSIPHTFFQPGEANLRVVVRSHRTYETSVSAPVTYHLARPAIGGSA